MRELIPDGAADLREGEELSVLPMTCRRRHARRPSGEGVMQSDSAFLSRKIIDAVGASVDNKSLALVRFRHIVR